MTSYDVIRNFITVDECDALASWIKKNLASEIFIKSDHPGTIRRTTRFTKTCHFPKVVYEIQNRIDTAIVQRFELLKIYRVPSFIDGMYASYGMSGDKCKPHIDPVWLDDTTTYHFNIILNDFVGAELILDNTQIKLNKSDAILYPVSKLSHGTSLLEKGPRLYWCFGYCIPNTRV